MLETFSNSIGKVYPHRIKPRKRYSFPFILKTASALVWKASLIILFVVYVYAEEMTIAETSVLTLDECIKYALANNPKLRQTIGTVDINRARVGEARSDYLPKATTTLSYATASKTVGFIAGGGLAVEGNSYSEQTGLGQLIWDFGKTLNQIKLAKENLTAAELAFLEVQEDTILNTKSAYFNVLKAQLLLDVAKGDLGQSKVHLERAKGFYEVGLRQKFDVTKAEVGVSNATLDYAKAKKNYELAKANLNNIMGKIKDTKYKVQEIEKFNLLNVDINEALQTATKNRVEILKREAEARAAQTDVEVKKKGNWPKITADTSHGIRHTDTTGTLDGWNLGVLFSWPWFDSFKTRSQVEAAEANLRIAKSNIEEETLNVVLEVQDAVLSLEEAKERINATEKLLQEASENLEIAEARYAEGLGSIIEVSDAEVSMTSAKKNYVVAISDYLISQAKYEKSVGVIGQSVIK